MKSRIVLPEEPVSRPKPINLKQEEAALFEYEKLLPATILKTWKRAVLDENLLERFPWYPKERQKRNLNWLK